MENVSAQEFSNRIQAQTKLLDLEVDEPVTISGASVRDVKLDRCIFQSLTIDPFLDLHLFLLLYLNK